MPLHSRVCVNVHFQPSMIDIESKIERITESGCWVWMRAVDRDGYAVTGGFGCGKTTYVHRLICEQHNGPIPAGYHVDHLCRVKSCVNPAHLEAVTPAENTRRMRMALGPLRYAPVSQCKRGHPFDEENTQFRQDGKRNCKACKRAWAVAHRGS